MIMQAPDSEEKRNAPSTTTRERAPVTLRLEPEVHARAQAKFRRVGGSFQGTLTALLVGYLDGDFVLGAETPVCAALDQPVSGHERHILAGVLDMVRTPANSTEEVFTKMLADIIETHYDALTEAVEHRGDETRD